MTADNVKRDGVLVVVPCGQKKIWDKSPSAGPTEAKNSYLGSPFVVNRSFAEHFGEAYVILSAKHGFIEPDFKVPGPYNVTFKRKTSGPVSVETLREQVRDHDLDRFEHVIGLGGKEYRAAIEAAFQGTPVNLHFPFSGLPIGKAMQATKRAMATNQPFGKRSTGMIRSRDAVIQAVQEFDRMGRKPFLAKYGFRPAKNYVLVHDGKHYDSKAIVGAAYGYENPSEGPLRSADFRGGANTVQKWLEYLGFEVLNGKERRGF